jgi:ABC-type dipeptide/oligopeptide/nickel transport system ATPase component
MLEIAETETLFEAPQTDYARHLLDLMPRLGAPVAA